MAIRKAKFSKVLATILCCVAATATAHDVGYKLLEIDGYKVRWTKPSSGPLVLTYKVVASPTPMKSETCSGGLTSFDALAERSGIAVNAIKEEVSKAFRMWEGAANVKFRETDSDDANILIGTQLEPVGWAFADVFFNRESREEFKPITKGLVCLNPEQIWKVGFGGASNPKKVFDLLYTFTHEIGHVLGLDHPVGGDQLMGFRYHENFRSPQVGDARGVESLYGKPITILVENN